MGIQTNILTNYAMRMADISVSRHPLRRDVLFIYNAVETDIYKDTNTVEEARIFKQAIVRKNPDMWYVQETYSEYLVEDSDKLPWLVLVTLTGLARAPRWEDKVLIDGMLFTVSAVKPFNRDVDSIVECMVYPERADSLDPLALYGVRFRSGMDQVCLKDAFGRTDLIMDMIWGGKPTEWSFDTKTWYPFANAVRVSLLPVGTSAVYVRDASTGIVASFALDVKSC